MKSTLKPGVTATLRFTVPADKTVPHLFSGMAVLEAMPAVFATPFLIGLFECACTDLLHQHLEENEVSLGVRVDVSHVAATLPGQTVTIEAEVSAVEGRRVIFRVKAHDGVEVIGEGRHERIVVARDKFAARVNAKAAAAGVAPLT